MALAIASSCPAVTCLLYREVWKGVCFIRVYYSMCSILNCMYNNIVINFVHL